MAENHHDHCWQIPPQTAENRIQNKQEGKKKAQKHKKMFTTLMTSSTYFEIE